MGNGNGRWNGFPNLKGWSDEHAGLIALLGFVLVPVTGYFALMRARSGQVTMADQLGDATSWPGLIEDFRKGRSEGYFAAIGRVLRLAERVYGPPPCPCKPSTAA